MMRNLISDLCRREYDVSVKNENIEPDLFINLEFFIARF